MHKTINKREKVIMMIEEAIRRIEELEIEVSELKAENEKLRRRNFGGRKRHDKVWLAAYNEFVNKYRSGKTIKEMVSEGEFSRRTAYRYLRYYTEMKDE